MLFGANTFIWESPFNTAQHLGLIDRVAQMGFDVFEIAVEDPALVDVQLLRTRLDQAGLQGIICGAFGPDRDLSSADADARQNSAAYIRTLIDMAASIGSPLVIGPMYAGVGKAHPATEAEVAAEYQRSVEGLGLLVAYAGERGVRLAIEPLNRFETDMINTVEQALSYCDAVGSPHLGLHIDTFHMHLEEKDSAQAIRQANSRIFHIHACENDRGVPGTGQVQWTPIFAALHAIGYADIVSIESFTPAVKSIAKAVCIWRKIAPDQDSIAREGLAFLKALHTGIPQGAAL